MENKFKERKESRNIFNNDLLTSKNLTEQVSIKNKRSSEQGQIQ